MKFEQTPEMKKRAELYRLERIELHKKYPTYNFYRRALYIKQNSFRTHPKSKTKEEKEIALFSSFRPFQKFKSSLQQ